MCRFDEPGRQWRSKSILESPRARVLPRQVSHRPTGQHRCRHFDPRCARQARRHAAVNNMGSRWTGRQPRSPGQQRHDPHFIESRAAWARRRSFDQSSPALTASSVHRRPPAAVMLCNCASTRATARACPSDNSPSNTNFPRARATSSNSSASSSIPTPSAFTRSSCAVDGIANAARAS